MLLEILQPLLIGVAVGVGWFLGSVGWVQVVAPIAILPCLMLLLVTVFLQVPLRAIARLQRAVTVASVAINFIWTPVLAWVLGAVFLPEVALRIGFLMLLVTPCTDWYLVFTGIAGGNVGLSTALLPLNLGLQLLLLPLYLWLLAGSLLPIPLAVLLESIAYVFVIPLGLAQGLRWGRRSASLAPFVVWVEHHLQPLQLGLLCLAIASLFASEGRTAQPWVIAQLLPPLLLFFSLNLGLAWGVSRWLGSSYADWVSLSYVVLARNSPVALAMVSDRPSAIAIVAFPDLPQLPLVLVVGPLIELPVLALLTQGFRRFQAVPNP